MKTVPVEESVDMVLCQDITRIVPGEFKGVLFKKGHIIRQEDIESLLSVGKEHIYVWETQAGDVHENEAALRIAAAISGVNIRYDEEIKEGKALIAADNRGLLVIDSERLIATNSIEYVTIATLPNFYPVEQDMEIAGARVIPLVVPEETVATVENICGSKPILNIHPYHTLKSTIITTGNEVFKGRIEDKFGPVMRGKIAFYGGEYLGQTFCPDDKKLIAEAIIAARYKGAELIILTGGMSVDPDDLTPAAIKDSGAKVITYGAPAQPGNMLMLAYLNDTAIVGVPGCAMFFATTILDAVLPRIFGSVRLTKQDFAAMGEGGLCQRCEKCTYPRCYFCRV